MRKAGLGRSPTVLISSPLGVWLLALLHEHARKTREADLGTSVCRRIAAIPEDELQRAAPQCSRSVLVLGLARNFPR